MKQNNFFYIFIVCGLSLSCAHKTFDIKKYTYPPSFKHISKKEISSQMWKMAFEFNALEKIFSNDDTSSYDPNIIINKLELIESLAQNLPDENSNHPLLKHNLDQFLFNIQRAKSTIRSNKPNYFSAKQISGYCNACHSKR